MMTVGRGKRTISQVLLHRNFWRFSKCAQSISVLLYCQHTNLSELFGVIMRSRYCCGYDRVAIQENLWSLQGKTNKKQDEKTTGRCAGLEILNIWPHVRVAYMHIDAESWKLIRGELFVGSWVLVETTGSRTKRLTRETADDALGSSALGAGCFNPFTPSDQFQVSPAASPAIFTSHSTKNLAFHSLLSWKIKLTILTEWFAHFYLQSWDNVHYRLMLPLWVLSIHCSLPLQ